MRTALFSAILGAAACTLAAPAGYSQTDNPKATDAQSMFPNAVKLNVTAEGVSVDQAGNLYAVNATHFINLNSDKPLLIGVGSPKSHFASSRFTRKFGALVGDAVAHKVVVVAKDGGASTDFFTEPKMLQPNDMAINKKETFIYTSGMDYAANKGELWVYDLAKKMTAKVDLAPKEFFRTNGIELSNDDKTLYLSSGENDAKGNVVGAKIFRFQIGDDGMPSKPELAIDLVTELTNHGLDAKGAMDPDGMRMATDGTLFITLNGFGRVLAFDTNKKSSKIIDLSTVGWPTNLELGGEDGKLLVVVGRCKNAMSSCVDKYMHGASGRAWTNLQPSNAKRCE